MANKKDEKKVDGEVVVELTDDELEQVSGGAGIRKTETTELVDGVINESNVKN